MTRASTADSADSVSAATPPSAVAVAASPPSAVLAGPRIRKGPGRRLYRWFSTHVQTVDVLLTGVLSLVLVVPYVIAGVTSPTEEPWQNNTWVTFATSIALTLPLVWRRTGTVAAGIAMAAVCLVQVAVAIEVVPANALVLMMVYALAAYAPRWASLGGFWLGILGAFLLVLRYTTLWIPSTTTTLPDGSILQNSSAPSLSDILGGIVYVGFIGGAVTVVWLLGDITRNRIAQQQELRDHAERLEIQQQQERDLAAADERSRIAREMHDVVAHSLSVIITQADGARYASVNDPQIARQTLETIAETGRSSLHEMRRLLGVLHDDSEAATRPMPTVADIPELVETVRLSGAHAQFVVTGDPEAAAILSAGAQLVVYRVVQEALTNVLKHAGPNAHTTVTLDWGEHALQLQIDDDGRGALASDDGAGNGLRGMRERLALYDGTVAAHPRTGGGFQVHATLPYENGAA